MRIHWRDPNMSLRKWLRAVALIIAPFVLIYVIAKPLVHSYFLAHLPRRVAVLTEREAGRSIERVAFRATDGVELVGWFVPGDGNGDGATIVVSHGSGASGSVAYPGVAFLSRVGYNLFVLDHRAHGQSGGKASTLGPHEVRDLRGAVAYLRSRPDVDPDRIGAMGCSMGSGVVIGAAAEDPSIKAVVAEAVYADMVELWYRFGYVGVRGTPIHWSWGRPLRWGMWLWTGEDVAAFKPVEQIGRISPRSVLIIHGEHDNAACTVADARRLYQAAERPKELWIVPGAGHCQAHAARPEEYEARVIRTFDNALRW
jgi:dipeptidyl aminopeptidase/acylaminoacyl peptidase